jgi:MoaA/NifB/PqqE/SkfB family radical SAM enzyme
MFEHYLPKHRERLKALLEQPDWQETLANVDLERVKAEALNPPSPPSQLTGAAQYLLQRNSERVKQLLGEGVTDEEKLLDAFSDWETALSGDERFPILFLGLVLTLDCSFDPVRCLYCNQAWLPQRMELDDWKAVIEEVANPTPPYIYLTGGEPLLLGEGVWGDDGLVAFAVRLGCAVNINTNAELITPKVAINLVKSGLARIHISLDSHEAQLQAKIFRSPERVEKVLRGIFNLQIARELLGVRHPQIHINCVLTNLNLEQFPDFLRFLLSVREAHPENPLSGDFAFHLIPVGGAENENLRPNAEQWRKFYTKTWAEAEKVWQEYQESIGVPSNERRSLAEWVPFANPFLRVNHRGGLDSYCEQAAKGIYWATALTKRCYVAPTQAFVLPDGSQHWCGAHAIRRPKPLGNVREGGVRANIRRNITRLKELPNEFCFNCAGATCAINQSVERILCDQIKAMKANSLMAS